MWLFFLKAPWTLDSLFQYFLGIWDLPSQCLLFWMFLFNFGFVSTPSDVLSPSSRVWAFGQNQHGIIIIITTTVTVIFNLPAVLTYCLGRISTKNLCGRTQRGHRRLCVWVRSAHAGFARIGLWEISFWSLLRDAGRATGRGWAEEPVGLLVMDTSWPPHFYFLKGLEGSGMSFLRSLWYCFRRWSAICVTGCGS